MPDFITTPWERLCYDSHLADEDTEFQRDKVI